MWTPRNRSTPFLVDQHCGFGTPSLRHVRGGAVSSSVGDSILPALPVQVDRARDAPSADHGGGRGGLRRLARRGPRRRSKEPPRRAQGSSAVPQGGIAPRSVDLGSRFRELDSRADRSGASRCRRVSACPERSPCWPRLKSTTWSAASSPFSHSRTAEGSPSQPSSRIHFPLVWRTGSCSPRRSKTWCAMDSRQCQTEASFRRRKTASTDTRRRKKSLTLDNTFAYSAAGRSD